MTDKTVNILVGDAQLHRLKAESYKLCFAKKVGNAYNVVWQAYDEYLADNSFSWTPIYQAFITNTFKEGLTVKVQSKPVTITLGQQATIDTAGAIGTTST